MKKDIWKEPQKEKSLNEAQVPLWFWNDKLDKDELIRQLKLQTEIGVTCTNPHARTNQGKGYIGGYLDEEWFDQISAVVDYKKAQGETLWLYDELDWPAGTCNKTITKNEEYREQYLDFKKIPVPAGQPFRAQLKELTGKSLYRYQSDPDQSSYAFNIFILDAETQESYDITEYFKYLIFGPELEFVSDRDAVVYLVKVLTESYQQGGSGQVSYLNPEATKAFLASTYDKYYEHYPNEFGSTINCIFNDETRMCNALAWYPDFPAEFQKRKGYSIMPRLVDLILPGETAGRTRCDYLDVLAALYQEHYFGEIHKWCQAHNIQLFAHLLGEETIFGHTRYSGDYLRQNKYLDIPGADHLGKGIGSLNIKYTASGAHSYGKDLTAVEVFAGCGWDMTFEEYLRMVTWMYQQGMKIIINHGFFYSDRGERKNDWPPSQFFQWQGWPRMKEGNAMIRRLHYALTGGVSEMDILLYHPIESFWLQYQPDINYTHGFAEGAYLKNDQAVKIDHEMQLLMNGLLSENLDFELLHKDAVENFGVRNGKIENRLNGQRFSVLVLPMCRVLPVEAARLCKEFAESGGQIIAVDEIPSISMAEETDEELNVIFEEIRGMNALTIYSVTDQEQIFQAVRERIPHPVRIIGGTGKTSNNHPSYPPYMIDPYMHGGEDLTGVQFTRYQKDGARHILFVNYNSAPEVIQAELETAKVPEVWDTLTGEVKAAKVIKQGGNSCIIELLLPCNYGIIVTA